MFISLRQAGDNTRRVIDLVEVANRAGTEALLLSLDAEKAFDRLGWPFLFATLQRVGMKGPFLQAIAHLYSSPLALVRTQFASSPIFPISNGTRQGCPLSPLLYALCIEPLAAHIRQNPNIRGIPVHTRDFKISLFADDVLLTLTQPQVSLPNLHVELDRYSALSGYKINNSKTEALPLNIPHRTLSALSQSFGYAWKTSALKYLGVYLTPSYDTLYKANFPQLYTSIRASLAKWKNLNLSLFGRLATIKMAILPKLLYLYETLPIPIPAAHFRAIQGDLLKFLWNYKRHRIARSVLYAPRDQGGLAFPNIAKYYLAAQLRSVASWCTLHAYNRWTQIEKLWLPLPTLTPCCGVPTYRSAHHNF